MSCGYTGDTADQGEVVLCFVGPVRVGWGIENLIVIGERIMERRWKGPERELI